MSAISGPMRSRIVRQTVVSSGTGTPRRSVNRMLSQASPFTQANSSPTDAVTGFLLLTRRRDVNVLKPVHLNPQFRLSGLK